LEANAYAGHRLEGLTKGEEMKSAHALTISISLVLASSAYAGTSWDLEGDWAPPANPNGAWSYGQYVSGSFQALPWDSTDDLYDNGSTNNGFVYRNNTGSAEYGLAPGAVSMESNWGTPVVRWTAPTSGMYDIGVEIGGTENNEGPGYGNHFASYSGLKINGAAQGDTSFANNVKTWTLNSVFLAGGSAVDAYVPYEGFGGGDNQTFFHVAAVPEPAPFAIVGLGLLGLWRKRKA
jgi:hypothetical protein